MAKVKANLEEEIWLAWPMSVPTKSPCLRHVLHSRNFADLMGIYSLKSNFPPVLDCETGASWNLSYCFASFLLLWPVSGKQVNRQVLVRLPVQILPRLPRFWLIVSVLFQLVRVTAACHMQSQTLSRLPPR